MKMYRVVWTTIFFCCFSCTSPYEEKIPGDLKKLEDNPQLKKAVQRLPQNEQELLLKYVMRAALGQAFGAETSDISIKDALDNQREFEKQQKEEAVKREKEEAERQALAERIEKERKELIDKMRDTVTVAILELSYHASDWTKRIREGFDLRLAFENKTNKNIAGIKGVVTFTDIFDDEIKSVNLSMDNGIPAGETMSWAGGMDFNQFNDEDRKLSNTPFEKIKSYWIPQVILFEDGTSLKLPNN